MFKLNRVDIIAAVPNGVEELLAFFIYDTSTSKYTFQEVSGASYQNAYINNLIANDFNQDGLMDMLVTVTYKDTNITKSQVLMQDGGVFKISFSFNNHTDGLFVADLGDTSGLDIVFYDNDLGQRKYLYFSNSSVPIVGDFTDLMSNDTKCDKSLMHSSYPISSPHSSAFLDVDGDCLNDMMIMSQNDNIKYLEIWRGVADAASQDIKYCLTQSSVYELNPQLGLFTLADVDRDGMIDIVFPILASRPPQILVAFNKVGLVYDWTADYCATHIRASLSEILKVFDDFIYSAGKTKNTNNVFIIPLTNDLQQTFYNDVNVPTFLRFGDVNIDSYNDFTTVFINKSTMEQIAYVFLNTEIIDDGTSTASSPVQRRTFTAATVPANSNTYIVDPLLNNAIYSSFLDFGEDGRLDMIVVYQNNGVFSSAGYWNGFSYDAFYLKSLILDQLNIFYSNELGTTMRFICTNIDGSRRMDLAAQSTQTSASLSLNLPYGYIGIGRSNNYIENFAVISGNYYTASDNYRVFTPIIPNSQLIVQHSRVDSTVASAIPVSSITSDNSTYANNTNTNANTNQGVGYYTIWKLDLIVKPTSKLSLLITTVIFILIGLLMSIVYLTAKEMKEDNEENQENFAQWY